MDLDEAGRHLRRPVQVGGEAVWTPPAQGTTRKVPVWGVPRRVSRVTEPTEGHVVEGRSSEVHEMVSGNGSGSTQEGLSRETGHRQGWGRVYAFAKVGMFPWKRTGRTEGRRWAGEDVRSGCGT